MQKWKPNPEVIKNDRYKSAEIAYMEIQKYCKVKRYMFFQDMTEEEFVNITKIMFKVPGWLVPLDRKEEFISDRELGKYRDKWKDCYLILGVFHAFEDDGKWYFSVNIDGKNMEILAYKKLEK
jgi:hypothetical protein